MKYTCSFGLKEYLCWRKLYCLYLIPLLSVSYLEIISMIMLYILLNSWWILFKAFDYHFILLQGQDGVDLEMLNGSKSKYEDDDLDNMVFLFVSFFLFTLFLEYGEGGPIFLSLPCLLAIYLLEDLLTNSIIHMAIPLL